MATAKRTFYATRPGPNRLTLLYTRDVAAFEIIVGWGSGSHGQVHADFYGTNARPVEAAGIDNLECDTAIEGGTGMWRWFFGPEHARVMLDHIAEHGIDPNYYDEVERTRAVELKAILKTIVELG